MYLGKTANLVKVYIRFEWQHDVEMNSGSMDHQVSTTPPYRRYCFSVHRFRAEVRCLPHYLLSDSGMILGMVLSDQRPEA